MVKYFIGTSGWSYEHWTGKFYPENLEKNKWLEFYSKKFNSVELNMSFYRFPFPNMLKSWNKKLPDNFKMTLKANRQITHVKKLKNVKTLVKKFYDIGNLLGEKLGCILFQIPPSMKNNEKNLKKLESFLKVLKSLGKEKRNVIEFRDKSWWNEDVYRLLKKYNVAFCIVNGLNMPLDIVITSNFAYLRFHGSYYSTCYSEKQMKEYADKIKKIKVGEVYAYFNNDKNAYAVKNAKQLRKFIS